MYSDLFTAESLAELKTAFLTQFPMALWETFYVTVLSTALAILLGLPLGVLLVAGEKDGVLPLPKPVLSALNVIINLLRSIPFLILMIMVFPLSRLIIGTAVGTTATIVPLVVAAFPFVARLVESSLREVDPNIIEAAPEHGRNAHADHLQGDDSRKRAVPDPERHHLPDHHSGLLRHERHHRRRRPGQGRHRLRLLPV